MRSTIYACDLVGLRRSTPGKAFIVCKSRLGCECAEFRRETRDDQAKQHRPPPDAHVRKSASATAVEQ